MQYEAYLQEIARGAEATGGTEVSLAGGYFGVQLTGDGTRLILALDLDSDLGWVVWAEDDDGERCCDSAEEVIGSCPLVDLRDRAFSVSAHHVHA